MTALISLPFGSPRTLLSDAVRLGRLLWERAAATHDVDIVADTAQLLAIAADAATDLHRVEEAGRVIARTETLNSLEESRQRLHDQLLDVVRAMGGANRRLPEAGGRAAELSRLGEAVETSRSAHAGAVNEVERLLA